MSAAPPPSRSTSAEWRILPTKALGGKRSHGAFVSLGNELLLLGGRDDSYNRLTTAVSYNWTNGVWNTLCSLPHRTSGCAAAVVDSNRVVVVGSASFNTSKSAWMYDDKNKSWSALPDLQVGRWNHACVCVDGKVYAIGGLEQDTIEVLDFSTAAATTSGWKLLPERMKKRRFGCSATVDCNGNIVVTGGYNDADGHLDSVEVFDTGHQVWTNKVPPMTTPRANHCIVALREGKTLVVVGGDTGDDTTRSVEMLRLENEDGKALVPPKWTALLLPPMNTPRRAFAAFAARSKEEEDVTNGIIVVGGSNGEEVLDTMEFLELPKQRP